MLPSTWTGWVRWECMRCGKSGDGPLPDVHLAWDCGGHVDGGGI